MLLEQGDQAVGQHRHPVLLAFAVEDDDRPPREFEVLDPQPQALHQSQATAVEELGHQLVRAR